VNGVRKQEKKTPYSEGATTALLQNQLVKNQTNQVIKKHPPKNNNDVQKKAVPISGAAAADTVGEPSGQSLSGSGEARGDHGKNEVRDKGGGGNVNFHTYRETL